MNKSILQVIAETVFIFVVILFLLRGASIIFATSGAVSGSKFGMLISIVNVINRILVLWCLHTILRWFFPDPMRFSEIVQFFKSIQVNIDSTKVTVSKTENSKEEQ
jgi:hypothetical protein